MQILCTLAAISSYGEEYNSLCTAGTLTPPFVLGSETSCLLCYRMWRWCWPSLKMLRPHMHKPVSLEHRWRLGNRCTVTCSRHTWDNNVCFHNPVTILGLFFVSSFPRPFTHCQYYLHADTYEVFQHGCTYFYELQLAYSPEWRQDLKITSLISGYSPREGLGI